MQLQFQQMPIKQCQAIIAEILSLKDIAEIRDRFSLLLQAQPLLNYNFGPGSIFWRGRKCDNLDGWKNVSDVWYPQPGVAKAGRLNNPYEPLLYLSSRRFTVFSEVRAKPADVIHILGCRIKEGKNIRIGLIGDLFHVYRTGLSMISSEVGRLLNNTLNSFDYEVGRSIVYVDAFLASVLRDPGASPNAYLFTRILGDLLLKKVIEVKSLFYPSIVQEGGMNLAVGSSVADDTIEVVTSSLVKIEEELGYGMYQYSHVRNCTAIDTDGNFRWEDAGHQRGWLILESVGIR